MSSPHLRILVLTTLWPNAAMPSHGVFVENRLRALERASNTDLRVVAPVPWFPIKSDRFGSWGKWASAPEEEVRHGIKVFHPRYFIPPKIGMNYAPIALQRCFEKSLQTVRADGWDFDLIDAHYFYPDGVAAVRLAKQHGKPVCVTARGTDINLIPKFERQRALILEAAAHANINITVADALRDEMIRLGVVPEKVITLRNGVDLETFQPRDRTALRQRLNLNGPVLISVGHLIERKGHHLVIEALQQVPEATLLIIGDGPEESKLKSLALKLKLSERVRFVGRIAHEQLPDYYTAADILVLASSREGWPNVLLEAMACGTPCVASPVWGSGEVIREPAAGKLAKDRTAASIAEAIKSLLTHTPERIATRTYAEAFSWDETAVNLDRIFCGIVSRNKERKNTICKKININKNRQQPTCLVTVDTEEQFDWAKFSNDEHVICDPADIHQFQKICENHTIQPIYFLTQPLMESAAVADYFKDLHHSQKATMGIHLHQWVTRPLKGTDYNTLFSSFQKNLPSDLHEEKLRSLIKTFEKVFSVTPNLHRAGRYGIGIENYKMLARLGLTHDFSPSAGFDFSQQGGPDFSVMSNTPFVVETPSGQVTVTPACGAHVIQHTRKLLSPPRNIGFATNHYYHGFASAVPKTPMRLSPEGSDLQDMKALTRHLIKNNTPVLTFTLHSTSLTAGANAYAPTPASVTKFLEQCADFFTFFRIELGGAFVSSEEVKALYQQ